MEKEEKGLKGGESCSSVKRTSQNQKMRSLVGVGVQIDKVTADVYILRTHATHIPPKHAIARASRGLGGEVTCGICFQCIRNSGGLFQHTLKNTQNTKSPDPMVAATWDIWVGYLGHLFKMR